MISRYVSRGLSTALLQRRIRAKGAPIVNASPVKIDHEPPPEPSNAGRAPAEMVTAESGRSSRPPGSADIAAMLEAARARAAAEFSAADDRDARPPKPRRFWMQALAAGLWSLFAIIAGGSVIVLASGNFGAIGLVAAAIIALLAALLFTGAVIKAVSPILLAGALVRRASGKSEQAAAQLAGAEVLSSLSIAERVLDADPDARLIARRDGVVAYANAAYFDLAREAGVIGPAGLPPRIDRLFAQQGGEATKVFRLCRAAKSAVAAEEVISQVMGLANGGRRRRFEVSVRAVANASDFVSWRLRELAIEEEQHDMLAASYADFPRPVFAIERSGQIAWANARARESLGVERGALRRLEDIVLGETAELTRGLWQVDQQPQAARIRCRGDDPAEATLTAFRRGGMGEGFVCVELAIKEETHGAAETTGTGDVSEAPFGMAIIEGEIGRDARIIECNRVFADTFGNIKANTPLARAMGAAALEELADELKRKPGPGGAVRPVDAVIGDGPAARVFSVYARPVKRRRGSYGPRRTVLYTVEITDRKRMEQDHTQDQKLKAIGFIAGEVAHDFNNVLTVILGNCEMLMLRHPVGDPAYEELVQIRENAQRAANMTKQLLAYSRKQTLNRKVQSLTDVILDFSPFLNRAIGEKVRLEVVNGRGVPNVKVDRQQLETAIMNLAVNARDAMAPAGGILTIRTRLVAAEEAAALGVAAIAAHDCALIEVADTGPGVPTDIMDKIFDPFFTTKEEGKGTGLGLSTVDGIIGQMGGAIVVANAPEGGAVFRVYLPAHQASDEDAAASEAAEAAEAAATSLAHGDYSGAGRILVVEDEDGVRAFVIAMLKRAGYEIEAAANGVEALEALEADPDYDLIITDVMMDQIDGPTFIMEARARLGVQAAVIFMSGYAETAVRAQLDAVDNATFIQKPFAMAQLGARVKDVLQARRAAAQTN